MNARLFNDTPFVPYLAAATQIDADLDMSARDVEILRGLAHDYAAVASLPEMEARRERRRRMNDLGGGRPVVWVNEVCWHEMNVDDELTNRCENPVALRIEAELRKTLYQWRHMPGDMVVEDVFYSPCIIRNSGFGIEVEAEVRETDPDSTIASRRFHNQILTPEDVAKIKDPVITLDAARSDAFHQAYGRVFAGILPVEKRGATGFWFAPWDDVVYWMGAETLLVNLLDEPELMHALVARLTDAYLAALDQWVKLGISGSNNTNVRVGSGGYGYTSELPSVRGEAVPPAATWGSSTAQIFGSVSEAMHREFGIDYELSWLRRFGLTYYGCCEPLSGKMGMLSAIPNLRKISVSPWSDAARAGEAMRGRYVASLKPSPAHFAAPGFDLELMRRDLAARLKDLEGCSVEVVMKDISTVQRDPSRLWRWARMALEEARRYE